MQECRVLTLAQLPVATEKKNTLITAKTMHYLRIW